MLLSPSTWSAENNARLLFCNSVLSSAEAEVDICIVVDICQGTLYLPSIEICCVLLSCGRKRGHCNHCIGMPCLSLRMLQTGQWVEGTDINRKRAKWKTNFHGSKFRSLPWIHMTCDDGSHMKMHTSSNVKDFLSCSGESKLHGNCGEIKTGKSFSFKR